MRAEDQFHVGVVVADFEAALAGLFALFGYQWCDELGGPTQVRLPAGEALLNFRCAYSRTSPRLEIVARIPGTLWEPTDVKLRSGVSSPGSPSASPARSGGGLQDQALLR